MDIDRIDAAIRAHRRIVRTYRNPGQAPEWPEVRADLAAARAFLESLESRTADQSLSYFRIRQALATRNSSHGTTDC